MKRATTTFRSIAGLALVMLAFAPLAHAQVTKVAPPSAGRLITADPRIIADMLKSQGFPVEMATDNDGDPMIRSKAYGISFIVNFYGCGKTHKDCTDILFYAGFTSSKQNADSLNEWNRRKRYSRAYIDGDGDPCVETDVDLDKGGMSEALFVDRLLNWGSTLGDFQQFISSDHGVSANASPADDTSEASDASSETVATATAAAAAAASH